MNTDTDTKPDMKPETKTETKPETKPETNPEMNPENKSSSLLKDMLTPGKNVKLEDYMNDNNKKAMEVAKTQGIEASVKHMLIHPKTGEPMSYAEMRYYYG